MAESLGWIREELHAIGRKLDDVATNTAEMKGMLGGHEEKLGEVRATVFGSDGSTGLKIRVDRLEQASETARNTRRSAWHWIEIAIGAAGTIIAGGVTGLVWWLTR